ncbi:MAG: hypothetical protein HS122_05845 [Opitutaceae bacterium]|nr:hypothetical protein [Opitutaceae bacterium]
MNASKFSLFLVAIALLGIGFNLAGVLLGFFSPLAFGALVISLSLLVAVRDYSSQRPGLALADTTVRTPRARLPLAA